MGIVSRKQRDGSRADVQCPSAIATYTQHMAGVDKGDQLRKYYGVRLKCTKNYKYVFWFALDVCITNAYILSGYTAPTVSIDQARLKNFHVALAKALIGSYNSCQRVRRVMTSVENFHHPSHHQRKRCEYCLHHRTPKRWRESVWQCIKCTGHPTLCLTGKDDGSDCWALWHKE